MGKADFDVFVENRPVAGQTLKGAVFIDVTKQISGSNLVVRLAGYEKTTLEMDWSKKKMIPKKLQPIAKGIKSLAEMCEDNNHGGRNYERTKDASARILSIEIPVGSQDMISEKKIEPGKYKLPFEIELPASLPSSMHTYEDRNRAEIVYSLEAQLKGSGYFKDYKTSKDIDIDAQALDEESMVKIPYEVKPDTMPIKIGYCKNAGDMTFGCLLDNTVSACGKSLQVTFACRNESTVEISEVRAKLVQIVRTEAAGVEHEHEKTLYKQTFGSWQGLNKITAEEQQSRQAGQGNRDTTSQKDQVWNELQEGKHQVTINIPRHATPTYEGDLIQVRHEIRVRVVSNLMFNSLAPCPKIVISVQIFDAPDKDTAIPEFDIPVWAQDVANFVMGSLATANAQNVNWETTANASSSDEPDIVVEAEADTPATQSKTPSVPTLLQMMDKTNNHIALIQQVMVNPNWHPIMKGLSASDYGSILKKIQMDFQKPPNAILLASHITRFTCAHVVESLSCPEWMRTTMVESLVKFCVDLQENRGLIESKLSDWEKEQLKDALNGTGKK